VHLRSILGNINTLVLPGQKSISNAGEAFDSEGNLKSSEQSKAVEDLCKKLVTVLVKFKQ
jgi:hypothetical protein